MRRSLTATAIAALVVSALVACTPQPPDRATTTVGADGFELALDGVTATGTGGVAPEGTQVTLERSDGHWLAMSSNGRHFG